MSSTLVATETSPKKLSLWREGLKAARRMLPRWWWVVGVSMALCLAETLAPYARNLFVDQPEIASPPAPHHIVYYVMSFFLSYIFIVLFFRREPMTVPPAFGWGSFWRWIKASLVVWLAAVAPVLLLFILASIVYYAALANRPPVPALLTIFYVAIVLASILSVFLMLRVSCARALAINDLGPAIKTSWRLTRGKCLRIFGNSILFGIIVLLLCLVVDVPLVIVACILFGQSLYQDPAILAGLIQALVAVPLIAASECFNASVCKILYEEGMGG